MPNTNISDLIQNYISAYNQFDVEGMLECFSNDCVFISISAGNKTVSCQNKNELQQLAEQSASYFTERTQTIKNLILNDDKAAVEIDYAAILKKDLPNGLKAGQKLNLFGVSFFTFRNGKILTLTDYS